MLRRKSLLSRTVPFILLGLLAFAVYLVFFVDVNEMMAQIQRADLPLYSFAFVASVLDMAFFALAWHHFLKPLSSKVSFKKAFIYSWVGNFVDIVVPAESVSNEISRIYLATRDGVDAGKAVASVVTQRILGMVIAVAALAVGVSEMLALRVRFSSLIQSLIFLVAASTAIFLSIILVLCFKEDWMRKIVGKAISLAERIGRGKWNLGEWRGKAEKAIKAFYESLRAFRVKPERLILPVTFSAASWIFGILVYYFVLAALGYSMQWVVLIVVYALVMSLKSVPIGVPAEVGVAEILMTTLFYAFGIPLNISAAATVLIRIVTVWFRLIVGFGATQYVGIRALAEGLPAV